MIARLPAPRQLFPGGMGGGWQSGWHAVWPPAPHPGLLAAIPNPPAELGQSRGEKGTGVPRRDVGAAEPAWLRPCPCRSAPCPAPCQGLRCSLASARPPAALCGSGDPHPPVAAPGREVGEGHVGPASVQGVPGEASSGCWTGSSSGARRSPGSGCGGEQPPAGGDPVCPPTLAAPTQHLPTAAPAAAFKRLLYKIKKRGEKSRSRRQWQLICDLHCVGSS